MVNGPEALVHLKALREQADRLRNSAAAADRRVYQMAARYVLYGQVNVDQVVGVLGVPRSTYFRRQRARIKHAQRKGIR